MLKKIKNLSGAVALEKSKQASIGGGIRPPCYESPTTDVSCVSPWIYVAGCGWTCMIGPTP